jgi:hypothetical protein
MDFATSQKMELNLKKCKEMQFFVRIEQLFHH